MCVRACVCVFMCVCVCIRTPDTAIEKLQVAWTDANLQDSWTFSSCQPRAHVNVTRAKRVKQWEENYELITERWAGAILAPV